MRLGVLTTGYPRFEGDVAGSFVEGMVRGLTARGHDVDVLAPASKDVARTGPVWVRYPKPPHWPETFYGAGVPDNTRDPRTWPGLVSYPFSLWRKARGRAREWDAVIGHFGVPCGWIAAQLGKPALVVWHSADVFLARKLPRRALRSLMRQHVHWFVTQAHADALAFPETNYVVSPMGASVLPADRNEARRVLNLNGHTVLVLGRLVPIKGVDRVLRSLQGSRATVLVAGDGPERAHLESLRGDLDVRFLGWVREPQKSALLHAADVLAIPSRPMPSGRFEGAPVVEMEARLAGLPVVWGADREALLRPPPPNPKTVSIHESAELAERLLNSLDARLETHPL